MKCLVTGGAGFIGSNLAIYLEKMGHEVVIIDNFSSGHRDNLQEFKGKVLEADVSEEIELDMKFDVIFHQAAITDPRYGDDKETLRQNVGGFDHIIKLAKKNNAKLIYASTANLYGICQIPMKEDQPKDIITAYGQSKLIMDEMASNHFNDMHIVGLRYFNVFGPNESHKGRPASMIYHLAKQMIKGENPRLFKMGEQRRDHIYVKDCVLANIKALNALSGVYNVGTGIATSFNEIVELLNDALASDLEIEYFEMPYDKETYQGNTLADMSKSKELLNFEASYSIKDAIEEYLEVIK